MNKEKELIDKLIDLAFAEDIGEDSPRNEKLVKILMKPSCSTSCAASISPV
jgi:hypothetical protein